METVRFLVRHDDPHSLTDDLFATTIGISGVESCRVAPDGRSMVVEYDTHFVKPDMIQRSIEGTGYPVEREHS